eukprot:754978-Hanusia_phi.AAC.2
MDQRSQGRDDEADGVKLVAEEIEVFVRMFYHLPGRIEVGNDLPLAQQHPPDLSLQTIPVEVVSINISARECINVEDRNPPAVDLLEHRGGEEVRVSVEPGGRDSCYPLPYRIQGARVSHVDFSCVPSSARLATGSLGLTCRLVGELNSFEALVPSLSCKPEPLELPPPSAATCLRMKFLHSTN